MSDQDKDKDVGANAEDQAENQAEVISDEALDDVDGGFMTFTATSFTKSTFSVSPINGETITAGSALDDIQNIAALRKRPGRIG